MSVKQPDPIVVFADNEIPNDAVRVKFLGIMLGIKLGYTRQQAARNHGVGQDDAVWGYIEKYDLSFATEFAEREIPDPALKQLFLELAPKPSSGFDTSHFEHRSDLSKEHPIWLLIEKYLKELLAKL